ncbi:S60 ribosomal protein L23a [Heterostelium album PN500]|uniref:S60 ribosomal protein L23a n=1 Tax=Heterostelium pallidum (strain ATCC 26659 / Pp 5 / PN500) TaxID=670386 RepID=D3B4P6_HETP5|nr:S60 ribosomal protein L23a [Heterostelium album PN500]EFA84294.1 S60 ribosomal protein L23a [Heterostelium album PN500]|eukprot:XP_020436410.1 S60 ribosomal protein L23a [Heterostelium album PN500]
MTKKAVKSNTPKQDLTVSKTAKKAVINAPAAAKKEKASSAAAAVKKGTFKKTTRKVRTKVIFRRPHVFQQEKNPSYPRSSVKRVSKMDQFRVLKAPLTTESATKKIESNNTITFMVDMFSNKYQIAQAVKKMYDVEVARVNTMITPLGEKKAFVKLDPSHDAADVANKIGLI